MKNFLMNKAEDGGQDGGGKPAGPDLAKVIQDSFKALQADLNKLNSKVDEGQKRQQKAAPEPKREEDDLSTTILVDPAKAVSQIAERVKKEVIGAVSSQNSAKEEFGNKFNELYREYPEISNQDSELHARAKEIMATLTDSPYDASALERAVYRAAAEKGITPMKHRKKSDDDASDGEYLGSGGGSGGGEGRSGRRAKSEKLPAATLAFAEAVGMNTKDPKVVERLTARHNDRKSNWSRYR